MPESLVEYALKAFKLSPEDWAAEHPYPALVIDPFQAGSGGFKTRLTDGAATGAEPSLAWIRKRGEANAFEMMITIGRAQNNDIEIDAQDVSKFHAYIQTGTGGAPTITDAGSTLGTFVNGRKLEATVERAALTEGTEIRLGNVRARYLSPQGLQRLLRSSTPNRPG